MSPNENRNEKNGQWTPSQNTPPLKTTSDQELQKAWKPDGQDDLEKSVQSKNKHALYEDVSATQKNSRPQQSKGNRKSTASKERVSEGSKSSNLKKSKLLR